MPEVRVPTVTYGRLDEVLRALGFSVRAAEENALVYKHAATGALVILPQFPPGEPLLMRHLVVVRTILENYGIVDPMTFTVELQKPS